MSKKIDNNGLHKFDEYMKTTSPSTRGFYDDIAQNSCNHTSLGAQRRAQRSVEQIRKVDPNHLPSQKMPSSRSWGTEYSRPSKKDKYKGKYTAPERNKHRFLAYGLAALVAAGGIIGGATAVKNQYDKVQTFNSLSVDTNNENGYDINISSLTLSEIRAIEQSIESARNSNTQPTNEELLSIKENLDTTYSNVISDLVTQAFEDANPGCTVTSVTNEYNYSINIQHPEPEEFITISYTDKNGEEKTKRVIQTYNTNGENRHAKSEGFDNIMFAGNPLADSFTIEKELDDLKSIINTNNTFSENAENTVEQLDRFEEILNGIKHLAGTKLEYKNRENPVLKVGIPNRTDDETR